jgi:hypothetical protein
MLDRIGLTVAHCAESKRLFAAALAPFGYTLIMEFGTVGGFGAGRKPDFWISQGTAGPSVHVAFATGRNALSGLLQEGQTV